MILNVKKFCALLNEGTEQTKLEYDQRTVCTNSSVFSKNIVCSICYVCRFDIVPKFLTIAKGYVALVTFDVVSALYVVHLLL